MNLKPRLRINPVVFPVLIYILPFDIVFTEFHNLFFEPGTWVFEANDLLPNLFPNGFFYNLAFRIFGISAIFGGIMVFIGYFWK